MKRIEPPLLAAGAVLAPVVTIWVAARPGHVSFMWLGYRLDTSIGVALAVLMVLLDRLMVFSLLHALWRRSRASHDRTRRTTF
jgi:uncharacterized membrane-anchored protein